MRVACSLRAARAGSGDLRRKERSTEVYNNQADRSEAEQQWTAEIGAEGERRHECQQEDGVVHRRVGAS